MCVTLEKMGRLVYTERYWGILLILAVLLSVCFLIILLAMGPSPHVVL